MSRRTVVVVGPDLSSQGGIALVNRTYADAGLFSKSAHEDLDVSYFPASRDGSWPSKLLYSLWRLAVFLTVRVDDRTLVHVHSSTGASFFRKWWYARIARLRGGRVLLHVHPTRFVSFYRDGGLLRRRAIRSLLRSSTHVLVLTRQMSDAIREMLPGVAVEVLPNPVPYRDLANPEKRQPRSDDLIVFLGWYVEKKGVFDLVEAMDVLRRSRPSVRAVFGGTKRRDRVLARVRELGLSEAITVHGWLDRDRVIALLRSCAIFVLPSYSEGMPMVLLEAMSCGAPIVTCPVGGIPEIVVEGRNALFVAPGDAGALAAAMSRLLDEPRTRESFSAASLEDARAFDVDALAPRLLRIYRRCLGDETS